MKTGKITQVIGPVVDVDFGDKATLPPIYNALKIKIGARAGAPATEIVAEVVKHLEPGKVRALTMAPTDGLNRGAAVEDMGKMMKDIMDQSPMMGKGKGQKMMNKEAAPKNAAAAEPKMTAPLVAPDEMKEKSEHESHHE